MCDNIPNGKTSQLVLDHRHKEGKHLIAIKIYRVKKDEAHPQEYKYSLALIKAKERILCYDNHERKGPHIHVEDKELKYDFKSAKKLVRDFEEHARKMMENES